LTAARSVWSGGRRIAYPRDPTLAGLGNLFDTEWVWEAYCQRFGGRRSDPRRLAVRLVNHSPGRRILVSYRIDWQRGDYLPSEYFTVLLERGDPVEMFRYPADPYLPGLAQAADPGAAHRLIGRHVLVFPGRRVRVELVRYRPRSRAVLRHRLGKVKLYVRVMRPAGMPSLLEAAQLVARSGFAAPRVAGRWDDGGVVWLSEIPGINVRQSLRQGNPPTPDMLLDGLESLWSLPRHTTSARPFGLRGRYYYARRVIRHALENHRATSALRDTTRVLDRFVDGWAPSGIAHNDFYDDQMIVLPDGRPALVDFEEAGPGDPMLDIGNFLAHLRWNSTFNKNPDGDPNGVYYDLFRSAALERYRWNEADLNLREAVCLFRIATNPIRRPRPGWRNKVETGLHLVNNTLN